LVSVEGMILGLAGGVLGAGGAAATLHWGGYSLSSEGLSLVLQPRATLIGQGLGLACALGLLASLAPAWRASHTPIVSALRQM
jgi:putative ABC transport system permease protein